MTSEHLQLEIVLGPDSINQTEAVDGSAEDGSEVGVVGLVAGIGGTTKLDGGEGMDEPCFAAGCAKGFLDGSMIDAGAFHGDQEVLQLVLLPSLLDQANSGLKVGLIVSHGGRRDQHLAEEVAEQQFRT